MISLTQEKSKFERFKLIFNTTLLQVCIKRINY